VSMLVNLNPWKPAMSSQAQPQGVDTMWDDLHREPEISRMSSYIV